MLSGNGSTVAFKTQSPTLPPPVGGCWGSPGQQIAVVGWDGSDLHLVTGICLGAAYPGTAQIPDITDDGTIVFYAANEIGAWAIERVNHDVTGLEDDSIDASTAGHEDTVQPASGEVLFYLYRGSEGAAAGPGSYGDSSNGNERVPASGDCTE